jgi:rSAM/selenodomain-associated transferase 1
MPRPDGEPVTIAVLARAPIPGEAKTRLIPALGEAGAAALQARLIDRTARIAAAVGPVVLWATPDTAHPCFADVSRRHGVALMCQPPGDLGVRLDLALRQNGGMTLAIGTDCPALAGTHLTACADVLRGGCDAVLIPVEDGGYALIGLRAPQPELFADMPWGTNRVAAETRRRLRRLNLTWREPSCLWDLDVPDDLQRARREGFGDLLA